MRASLPRWADANSPKPQHIGLSYDLYAPVENTGNDAGSIPTAIKSEWIHDVSGIFVSRDYQRGFDRWRSSFSAPTDQLFEITTVSRLLVGHGNPSATEVGLTVHHTWGVPVIPGSALKGLTAHYIESVYGPAAPGVPPWEINDEIEKQRSDFRGVTWDGYRIRRGPGAVYRAIFGAPEAEDDTLMRNTHGLPSGATRGLVTFHDALFVPSELGKDQPFVVDVLTVHQKQYYSSGGGQQPNDYDDPNPVQFLTVKPEARFLIALSGPADWTGLAAHFLQEALVEWGIGAKTAAGYGRMGGWKHQQSDVLKCFAKWLESPTGNLLQVPPGERKATKRSVLAEIEATWLPQLRALGSKDREAAAGLVEKGFTKNVAEPARQLAGKIRY